MTRVKIILLHKYNVSTYLFFFRFVAYVNMHFILLEIAAQKY